MAAPVHDRFPPAALRDKRVLLPAAALALAALFLLGRSPRTALRGATTPGQEAAPAPELPVESWTDHFVRLEQAREWATLARELSAIQRGHPDLYERYRLGYLRARAALEAGDEDGSAAALEPFLAPGHPFRDLALYHAARLADRQGKPEDASRLRLELISHYPQATHRQRAVEDETAYLAAKGDAARLSSLAALVSGSVDAQTLRDIEARLVEAQVSADPAQASARGVRLLKAGIGDDAAERVSQAMDRARVLEKLAPADRVLVGEAARSHRRYDRAVQILEAALPLLPARRDDLVFSIGRAR